MTRRRRRLASALVICSGLAALTAPSAFGAPGEIAYRCNNNDICLLDPDAPSNVVNLSNNGSSSGEGYPFWSPDGSKVGFTSNFKPPNTTGAENLFVMDPNAPGQAINVAVQLTNYTSGTTREAVWSPDGSKVAFEHGLGVYVVNADGTSANPLTISLQASQSSHPTFSPDGTKLAFSINEQIYISNSDGSGSPQPLANAPGHSPVWSPDGAKIAFDRLQPMNSPFVNVNIVNADGSGSPVVLPLTNSQFSFAEWSPDGSRIAFRDTFGGGYGYYRVANPNGTDNHPLVQVMNQNNNDAASWSPDGARLAFSAFDGATNVHIVRTDGTGSDQALTTGGSEADAIWRPARRVLNPNPPLPGPSVKPKLVWITKRIPYSEGKPIAPLIVFCPVPRCETKAKATSKATLPGRPRAIDGARQTLKTKTIVVASGKTSIAQGETKKIKLKVTKAGEKLLLARGSLKLAVKARTKSEGLPTSTAKRSIRVYVK